MCHRLARVSAAMFLTAGVCGVSHGEIVRVRSSDSTSSTGSPTVAPTGGPTGQIVSNAANLNSAVPDPVIEFLDNPLRSTDLNPSPRQVVHEESMITPPVESQMVPLPPSFWTGMVGLLGLGGVRVAKRVRKTFL